MIILIGIIIFLLLSGIRILQEYERGVIFRLGRYSKIKGPGLIMIIPFIDRILKTDLRTVTLDVPIQEVITKDNIPVQVNAVCYFSVLDPEKAAIKIQNYLHATSQIAQTTLRSVCGEVELDEILSEREKMNLKLQQIIDENTDPWGIKISSVQIKDVQIPESMQRAFASQAEAERERRAKVIIAEGEFQASERLAQAAEVMAKQPLAIQLRYLQTLKEASANANSMVLAPLPLDLFKAMESFAQKTPRNQVEK